MGWQRTTAEMKLRKVKAQVAHVPHFAEKGTGEPAMLREQHAQGAAWQLSFRCCKADGPPGGGTGLWCHDGIGCRAEAVKAR